MASKLQSAQPQGTNYLYVVLGGLFLVALAVLLFYSFAPLASFGGCVGVIEINGPIVSKDIPSSIFSDEVKGSETLAAEIESAGTRSEVKSILVLIDSPGGSVVASREVYDAVHNLSKPSVSYINELGASGGYYVAAGTGYIMANPDAIVGSIGARATFSDMSGLFEKLGYNETDIKSGAMKDIGSQARPMTPEERAVIQSIVNESFAEFKDAVVQSRGSKLNGPLFQQALDARIMTGRQALKVGLVDSLGNKKAALKKAAELGGLNAENPSICSLSSSSGKKGLFSSISSEFIDFLVKGAGAPHLSYS
ncbi:MAG: signal peptide peptidase SppA [Candidatus Micrarchaeota archaeon]|nr:signal peptide peptidase SppA [Candidatus Micrarchaeota archaeon]